ncbi:hypothetical protein, partial [Photobacterium halotolerans]|uniref:ParE family toxin-like protein n=1 Tax=Photobacterium halotolerans TaxID=265726 RepID=UPI00047F3C26
SAIRQEVHNRNKPVKRGTNVPPDEKPRLTTKGTIPIDIVQKANAELVKFDMKILTPRVANKSRDYRYIHVGKYYRLLSKDAGETWQLMSFADFERHMK